MNTKKKKLLMNKTPNKQTNKQKYSYKKILEFKLFFKELVCQ